jgi:hypothetical protein
MSAAAGGAGAGRAGADDAVACEAWDRVGYMLAVEARQKDNTDLFAGIKERNPLLEDLNEWERVVIEICRTGHKCPNKYHYEHKPVNLDNIKAGNYVNLPFTVCRCDAVKELNSIVGPGVDCTLPYDVVHAMVRERVKKERMVLLEMLSKGNPLILRLLNGDRTLYEAALEALRQHEVACIEKDEAAMATTKVLLDRYISLMYLGTY